MPPLCLAMALFCLHNTQKFDWFVIQDTSLCKKTSQQLQGHQNLWQCGTWQQWAYLTYISLMLMFSHVMCCHVYWTIPHVASYSLSLSQRHSSFCVGGRPALRQRWTDGSVQYDKNVARSKRDVHAQRLPPSIYFCAHENPTNDRGITNRFFTLAQQFFCFVERLKYKKTTTITPVQPWQRERDNKIIMSESDIPELSFLTAPNELSVVESGARQ